MKKIKILISALLLTATSYAAEINVDANVGYTFNVLHENITTVGSESKAQFVPRLPVELGIRFKPAGLNLNGHFNVINKQIDGKFATKQPLTDFAVEGEVNFLSNKLVKGLRVAGNMNLVALTGNKYKGTHVQSGDLDIELGLNYDFGKVNTGGLVYYKSNALMDPLLLGLAFDLNTDSIKSKLRVAYNLEEYFGTIVFNPNNIKYSEAKSGDSLYLYTSKSEINKLIPIYIDSNVSYKKDLLENLSLRTSLNTMFDYVNFDGKLAKIDITNEEANSIKQEIKEVENKGKTRQRAKDAVKYALKAHKDKETTEVKYNNVKINVGGMLAFDYNIFEGLDMTFTDKLSLKYMSSLKLAESEATKQLLLSNNFTTNLKYVYEFEQIDGLSIIHNSFIDINSEFALIGTPKYSIQLYNKDYDNTKTTNVTSISLYGDVAVKYNIFETLSVKGGVGLELQSNIATIDKKIDIKYNQTIPKIFIGLSYEW